MREKKFIDWDAQGRLVDVKGNRVIVNSNIFNIVSVAFNPDHRPSTGHDTFYAPTGINVLVNRFIEYQHANGHTDPAVMAQVQTQSRQGIEDWTYRRTKDGRRVNLVLMFMRLSRFSAYAGMAWYMIASVCQALQAMGWINWEYVGTLNELLHWLGIRKKGTAERLTEDTVTGVMSTVQQYIPAKVSGALQTAWQNSGDVMSYMAVREAGIWTWGLAKATATFMTSSGWQAVRTAMGRT
jgi:hypothetical protein